MPEAPEHSAAQPASGTTRGWRVLSLIAFAGVGLLLLTSGLVAGGDQIRAGSVSDLPRLVRQQKADTDAVRAKVTALRREVDGLSEAADSGTESRRLRRQVRQLRPSAGMTMVQGEGVTVILDDAPKAVIQEAKVTGEIEQEELNVHQQDLQAVVNALWSGGATAISLMGHRIISTTGIKCVGNTVRLHGEVFSPPYKIVAIGDPLELQAALDESDWIAQFRVLADEYGLGYATASSTNLTVPAYTGISQLRSARAISDAGGR